MASKPTLAAPPPEAVYLDIVATYWRLLGVRAVAEAALADHLKDGPLTSDELAAKAQTLPSATYRIMRVSAWHNLPHSFRTGEVAWDNAYQGRDIWHWYRENPAQGEHFAKWMTQSSRVTGQAICKAFDFSAYKTIVDVGGGQGQFLTDLLESFPTCDGILFDQPQVVDGAPERPRMAKLGGNFFESVPSGGDLYIMKWIIHDWDACKAVAILQNIRKAMKPGAHLMLIEALVQNTPGPDFAKWMDINMMTITGGEERDEAEYRDLFDQAGFTLERAIPTEAFHWLLLAKPK